MRVRIRGQNAAEQVINLRFGKTTIGSSPRCDVRIQQAGVGPVHLLIVRDRDSLSVRSWASDSLLNGAPFQESPLKPGDCLAFASVELEVEGETNKVMDCRRLADRVEGLETLMEAALFEPQDLSTENADSERPVPPPAIAHEIRQLTEANDQLAREKAALEIEIESLRSQLQDASGTIEKLEQARAQWAVERNEWNAHRTEFQERLAEAGVQLTGYAERIEKIEQELAAVRANWAGTGGAQAKSELEDHSRTDLERMSASDAWPVTGQRDVDHATAAILPDTPRQSSFSDQQSPISDSQPSSYSTFQPSLTPEAPAAEFDWSDAGNSRASEWQAGSQGDGLRAGTVPVSEKENTTSPASHWSDWQSETGQSRNSDAIQAATPALLENAWPTLATSDTASTTTRESKPVNAEITPIGSSSVSAGEFNGPASSSVVPPESEDEYAPFAEFSIWNQGANAQEPAAKCQSASDASYESEAAGEAFTTPAGEQPSAASKPGLSNDIAPRSEAPTSSFIERYAHMFADDDSIDEDSRPVAPPPRQVEKDNLVRKPRAFGGAIPSGQAPASDEDEESIEQYMAKLMQRVRGEGPRVAASQAPIVTAPEVAGAPGTAGQASSHAAVPDEFQMPSDAPISTGSDVNKQEFLTTSLGTVRRKSVTVERPANLEAFRALANESARRAISTHALHKHRRNAVTKAIVATLAGMTSVFVMLQAPGWLDLQFITAGVSLLAAGYWAWQAVGTIVELFRAAAYHGPEELLENLIDPFRPALPIDVERSE